MVKVHFTMVMKVNENYNKNNEQHQLPEGFVSSYYKIVSPDFLQELINNFAIYKHCSGKVLLQATFLETTYFKKESHFLACHIFFVMLHEVYIFKLIW